MVKKSSKTEHVLNLLSPTIEEEEMVSDAPKTEQETAINTSSINLTEQLNEPSNKSDAMEEFLHLPNHAEDLSTLIKDNLEKEFEENVTQSKNINTANSLCKDDNSEEASIQQDTESTLQNISQDEDISQNIDINSKNTNIEKSIEQSVENTLSEDMQNQDENNTPNNKAEPTENAPFYVTNIFESIVKECVLDYMHRFNLCTCDRCIADVSALALTNLPSKYVVTDYENVAPLIHFLEHKYEVILMTELTKACLTVHAEPRHQIK